MTFNPRWIIGKTVARVDMRSTPNEVNETRPSHLPVIYFTDGSAISFFTQETNDAAYYGTGIRYHKGK